MNDFQLYQQRCSICFERNLDFCLERCRDQFCRACFERYIREITKGTWALNIVQVKCPVCFDVLDVGEWGRYVTKELVETYEKNSKPFKILSRHCPTCEVEVPLVSRADVEDCDENERILKSAADMFESLLLEDSGGGGQKSDIEKTLSEFGNRCQDYLDGDDNLSDIHSFAMSYMNECIRNPPSLPVTRSVTKRRRLHERATPSTEDLLDKKDKWARLSADLISLETNPQKWRELLFWQLKHFPRQSCTKCNSTFCFQCGEEGYHTDYTCLEWMNYLVNIANEPAVEPVENNVSLNAERVANLKWKITNSKSCPRCCTLINREEGCNKVDCLMCGHRFCWVCLSSWGDKCGFYRCKSDPLTPESPDGNKLTIMPDFKSGPEIGVPDVISIQSRLQTPVSPTAPHNLAI